MTPDHPIELLPPPYLGGPAVTGENCEREAIHIPGSIQPHGALLVVQADAAHPNLVVLQVSENLSRFIPVEAETALGQPLTALFGGDISQTLLDALPPGTPDHLQYRTTVTASRPLSLTAHRIGERLILEIEPPAPETPDYENHVRNAIFALEGASSLQELLEIAVAEARRLSGFDRVMLYRFAPDDSGEVVAESRREDLAPFLGHHFPESDIPAQARALYARHLLRLTADVNAEPAPLLPRIDPLTQAPTPLGGAVLRATSPMHLQYLRNMGVASSLSVSIVVEGRLWALISCHHTTPHVTPPEVRSALEMLGRLLNLQVRLKEQADIQAFRNGLSAGHQQVMNTVARSLTPLVSLSDPALHLRELLGADGLALHLEGQWRRLGHTPDETALGEVLTWLRETQPERYFVTDHFGQDFPAAQSWTAYASGLLAVSVGGGWQETVMWFRGEVPQVTQWGGAVPSEAKTELGPRQSFATYLENVRGHSRPFHAGEVAEAQSIGETLSATLGERLTTLRQLNQDLTRSNEEWRRFAFVISHDLQEPVRLIRQLTDLFRLQRGEALDPQTARLTELLSSETSRISSLITDLYTYTELLSYPDLKRQILSLNQLIGQSLQGLQLLIDEKKLEWTGPERDVEVEADPGRLQLALTHLLQNALSFGTAPVEITLNVRQDEEQTALSIHDNGPGVAPEFQERVFELFQRLGPPGRVGGNGVGLTLARKVAELHGGTLTMTSALGQGTTLTLTLPRADA